ncbi:MAG: nickel-dependent lactate racemase [Candidatus Altiarchaeales archaeon]|nr:nickel-dependent lactate racemase [Candidatus Altiarchaeales archaeon]MBD3417247.1 nickel-dependent lactate racemase [Candidatus Altiarchaeales archaeon]
MKLTLPYGDSTTEIEVDDDRVQAYIEPAHFDKRDLKDLLRESLEDSYALSLEEFLKGKKSILLVVNDLTRPTPTAKVLEVLLPLLGDRELKFIIATGSHKPPGKPGLKTILGEGVYEAHKKEVYSHEAKDDVFLRYAGETSRGNSIYLNKMLWLVDGVININSVEPHYFAGFTGGRKSFLPGVSSYKTITKNHSFALEEGSQLCNLEGNPVNEDMEEAAALVPKPIFSFNLVLDADNDVAGVFAGGLRESFRAACEFTLTKYTFSLEEKADVVLAFVERPMSRDLYQTQKVIEPSKLALKEGGVLIFVSQCDGGVGPENYYALMSSSTNPHEILMSIQQKYKLGYHKAARLLEIATWADMYAVTDLEDHVLERVFMKPFSTAQEAVDTALKEKGPQAKIIIIKNALITIPQNKA